jgi:hypothetical protein
MTNESEILAGTEILAHLTGGYPAARSPAKRGFAAMDQSRQRDIASKGGASVPTEKRSFSRDRELAVRAGRKGGQARVLAVRRRNGLLSAASPTPAE